MWPYQDAAMAIVAFLQISLRSDVPKEMAACTSEAAKVLDRAPAQESRHADRMQSAHFSSGTGTILATQRSSIRTREMRMAKKAKKSKASKKSGKRGMDRKLVAGRQRYEVDYESRKTGKSRKRVKKAVKRVGSSRKKVRKALSR